MRNKVSSCYYFYTWIISSLDYMMILGISLGIVARYDLKGILNLGINLGAVMLIPPRMVRILIRGQYNCNSTYTSYCWTTLLVI